ncbi:DNA-dependent metalloprotease SPRTN [Chaetodon auriga]|uniref:DNA-dependent metalloprotease SPRTN n=1 Tax=Chaetodon auriga TaxID=39042 RepID=UPI004032FF72
MDDDLLLAIKLQEQFNSEYETSLFASNGFEDNGLGQSSKKRKVEVAGGGRDVVPYWKPTVQPERPLSIVDESWEMLDPNPDVRAMFLEFNDMFFWGKLSGVEVKWSPRMTLCAGVCSYEGRGGLCSIRLSEPLLKLRPRKDLVETLLHEMIHALLFVTQNNRDRDGHGPEFCKHMNRINKASGTKISVYHSFHDEVDVYRQHWWKCNGPCQNRKPYFGFVKRAMNRAPSALDPWWEDHRRTCGGTYTKVKEPEGYGKKGKKDGKKDEKSSEKKTPGSGKPSGTTAGSGSQDIRNVIPFSGKGFLLGGKSQSSTPSSSLLSSLLTPSPASSLTSPVRSGPDNKGASSTFPLRRPATSTGQKPPVKRSVSNTKVFVSINGSPVRIPRSQVRQTSIEDLFSRSPRKSSSTETEGDSVTSPDRTMRASSASSFLPKQQDNQSASSPRTSQPSPTKSSSASSSGSSAQPTQPKNFNQASGAAGGGQASRKRPWDDRSSSAAIFTFFQKTLGSSSAASRESVKTSSPAMQQRAATSSSSSLHSSAGLPGVTPSSSSSSSSSSLHSSAGLPAVTPSSSSSSSVLMVSCPVCQAKVQESKINEHLDSCLS